MSSSTKIASLCALASALALTALAPTVTVAHTLVASMTLTKTPWEDVYSDLEVILSGHFGLPSYTYMEGAHSLFMQVTPTLYYEYFTDPISGNSYIFNVISQGVPPGKCYYSSWWTDFSHHGVILTVGETSLGAQPMVCTSPLEPPEDPSCPVLIDLAGDGIRLTGTDEPVSFDFDLDGEAESVAWTEVGTDDGFLCRDRNGDGVISNADELFGNWTRTENGKAAGIGYLALQELDSESDGGNQDGSLTPDESGYSQLCIWVDTNRDGISQPGEVQTLEERGVESVGYFFRFSGRTDRFGNEYRFASEATILNARGQPRSSKTYDVFFAAAEPD